MKKPFDILLIEDNEAEAELLRITFAEMPIINRLVHVGTNKEALEYLEENHPNLGLIISDFFINCEIDNEVVLKAAYEKNIPFIYLSGCDDTFTVVESFRQGALAFLQKPLIINQFLAVVKGLESLGIEIVPTKVEAKA